MIDAALGAAPRALIQMPMHFPQSGGEGIDHLEGLQQDRVMQHHQPFGGQAALRKFAHHSAAP